MSESLHNHPSFPCQGPLSEWERDTFDEIANHFTSRMADAPPAGLRESGTPSYNEFVTPMGTDADGNYNDFMPVRLHPFAASSVLNQELAPELEEFSGLRIGVSSGEQIANASVLLEAIGEQTSAGLQPDRERLL